MSAEISTNGPASLDNPASLDDLESILSDLIRISTEISHLQEELISRGIPFSTINSLVDRLKSDSMADVTVLLDSAIVTAQQTLGMGAVERVMLTDYLEQLVELNDDLRHIRKISAGHSLDPRAINILTQVVRTNPGDKGERVLNCLADYARAYGIKMNGLQLVASNEQRKPNSVLPDIQITRVNAGGFRQYQAPFIELLLGCIVAFTAITLLT